MKPEAYIHNLHARLLSDPIVEQYQISRERITDADIYIRARITLADQSQLSISEYGEGDETGDIHIVTYTYHWMDENGALIVRWDNAAHYPTLPGHPYHQHDGDEKNVLPSEPMSLVKVLDHIATRIDN